MIPLEIPAGMFGRGHRQLASEIHKYETCPDMERHNALVINMQNEAD